MEIGVNSLTNLSCIISLGAQVMIIAIKPQ